MSEEVKSWASSPGTRRSMQGNKARDTKPELAVRKLLHSRGLRYRVNFRPLPHLRRTADVVFTRQKVAVYIDGCFWHGCPAHYTRPASNTDFWDAKVSRNKARDADTVRALKNEGWTCLRFWTHEHPERTAESIADVLSERIVDTGVNSRSKVQPPGETP
jgi:DNA mismatch endonuclease (patch repair protein)